MRSSTVVIVLARHTGRFLFGLLGRLEFVADQFAPADRIDIRRLAIDPLFEVIAPSVEVNANEIVGHSSDGGHADEMRGHHVHGFDLHAHREWIARFFLVEAAVERARERGRGDLLGSLERVPVERRRHWFRADICPMRSRLGSLWRERRAKVNIRVATTYLGAVLVECDLFDRS